MTNLRSDLNTEDAQAPHPNTSVPTTGDGLLVRLSGETVELVRAAMERDEWLSEWFDLAARALDAVQRDIDAAEHPPYIAAPSVAASTPQMSTGTVASSPAPTTTTLPPPTPPPVAAPTPSIASSASQGAWTYEAATKVAICESGGWGRGTGGKYIGDLGILATNWYAYGGGNDTSPMAQIAVAARIQSSPPDQNGCGGGW